MNNSVNKPTTAFWIICAIALLWNTLGANAYLQQAYKTEAFKSQYNAEQLAIIDSSPISHPAISLDSFSNSLACG